MLCYTQPRHENERRRPLANRLTHTLIFHPLMPCTYIYMIEYLHRCAVVHESTFIETVTVRPPLATDPTPSAAQALTAEVQPYYHPPTPLVNGLLQ